MASRPIPPGNRPAPYDRSPFQAGYTAFGMLFLVFAAGCASPGPPRAPSLNLPQRPTDLTAQRVGNQVVLHWTTPAKTTENLALSAKTVTSLMVRVCRTPITPVDATFRKPAIVTSASTPANAPISNAPLATGGPVSGPPCIPSLRISVKPGASTATDTLPSALTADPIALLSYFVEIENAAGRTAGPSNFAFAPAGATPPAVEGLRATGIPSGTMLEWSQAPGSPTSSSVELDRNDTTPPPTPKAAAPVPTGAAASPASKPASPVQLAGQPATKVHLMATGSQQGTTDQTARFGHSYTYTAQRIRTVEFIGHPFELRSSPSAAVTLTLHDTFPPAPPRGLDAIPGGPGQLGIDLSWQANTETDLAGYHVYRQVLSDSGVPTAAPVRITTTPLAGPAYSDSTAARGQRYNYSVTALDTSGNESRPSPEIEETLP